MATQDVPGAAHNEDEEVVAVEGPSLKKDLHSRYFYTCLKALPFQYVSLDTSRLMMAYFGLSGLDLLDSLHLIKHKPELIDWIYSLQITGDERYSGFRGSQYIGCSSCNVECSGQRFCDEDGPHSVMTYTALNMLLILGDDLSRVDRPNIISTLKSLQQDSGSFSSTPHANGENGMRFLYTACAISYILNDWSAVDKDKACAYIRSCQSYEGGFASDAGREGHGGLTYCAVASLSLMGRLDVLGEGSGNERGARLLSWVLHRQVTGFEGRTCKKQDTCYSFWLGGTLSLLGHHDKIHYAANTGFLYQTQSKFGGFGKFPDKLPDMLHAYMGLSSFSLMQSHGVRPLNPGLQLSERAAAALPSLWMSWLH